MTEAHTGAVEIVALLAGSAVLAAAGAAQAGVSMRAATTSGRRVALSVLAAVLVLAAVAAAGLSLLLWRFLATFTF